MAEAFSVSYKIQDYRANLIISWGRAINHVNEGVYCKKETMSDIRFLRTGISEIGESVLAHLV